MRALIATEYGTPDRLSVAELPVPEAGPGQIQVRIAAASVNPTDVRVVTGGFADVVDITFPYVLGTDFAGTVTAVGTGVTAFDVGDEVFGQALPRQLAFAADPDQPSLTTGTLAEYAVFEAGTRLLAKRPASVPAEQAAALAIGGWTALGVMRLAEVASGERVFVVGALGGVGAPLVPLLVRAGAHVIATARTDADAATLRDLGVAEVVGYADGGYPGDVDVVCNLALFPDGLAALGRTLRPGGRLVSIVWPAPTLEQVGRDDVRLRFFFDVTGAQVAMDEVARAAAEGVLATTIGARYGLDDAVAAAEAFYARGVRGKVVVDAWA